MSGIPWTDRELELVARWFDGKFSKKILFEKIYLINPNRSFEAVCRKIRKLKEEGFVRLHEEALKTLRVGYLDIEASGLQADWSYMLCWAIKPKGIDKIIHSTITREEVLAFSDHGETEIDYRITLELLEAFNDFDLLWTHYGADYKYDLPYIRARALINNILDKMPIRDEKFINDTWHIAKSKLKLSNNRLITIAEACGIKDVQKTKIDKKFWRLGAFGNQKALDYILDHNIKDVQVLEKVHEKLANLGPKALRTF